MDGQEEGGQGNSGGQQRGRHHPQRRHPQEETAFGESGIGLVEVNTRIRAYMVNVQTAANVATTTAAVPSTSRPLNAVDVEVAMRDNAKALTRQLLDQSHNTTPPDNDPLAFLAGRVKEIIAPSVPEIDTVLDRARGNASRKVARSEINERVRDERVLKGLISKPDPEAGEAAEAAYKSLDRSSLRPDWRKPTAQGLAELTQSEAIKQFGDRIEQFLENRVDQPPSLDRMRGEANRWANEAVEKFLPEVLRQLIYAAAYEAAKGVAGEDIHGGSGHPDYAGAIGRLNPEALRKATLQSFQDLDDNDISRVLTATKRDGRNVFDELAAVGLRATDAARAMYDTSPDLKRAMREAAHGANSIGILKSNLTPILESYEALVAGKDGGQASATRPEREWDDDSVKIQGRLVDYARNIAESAIRNYKTVPVHARGPQRDTRPIDYWVTEAEKDVIANRPIRGESPKTHELYVRTAGKIAQSVIDNAKGLSKLEDAIRSSGRVGAEARLREEVNKAIEHDVKTKTKAAVKSVRHQPAVQQIIRETSAPTSDFPDGDRARRCAEIQGVIVEKVNELSRGEVKHGWLDSVISFLATPAKGATYSRDLFEREMFPLLPPKLQEALKPALEGQADRATAILGDIPFGLIKILADIHAHSMGYDRRKGDLFSQLLDMADVNARILFGSIPQYCGGAGHYSTAVPTAATMKHSVALDDRVVEDWLGLYNAKQYARVAKADLSITGPNFSDQPPIDHLAFTDPAAYVKQLLMDDRVDFAACGELTGIKEQVSRQLGAWRWNVGSEKFQAYLDLANETGMVLLLHNDWGDHTLSAEGRPAPAKQNYEHLDALKFVFGQEKYRDVQVVFAHTGIGRFVRPNDPVTTKEHRIDTWKWNAQKQHGEVATTTTKSVTAPEHIHKIYELLEAVPNARVDISWNEVTQAYMDLMHSDPAGADAIVQLFIDHGDRILFGSDTVKPVNSAQYHQSAMTGSPLFAEIVRRETEAAGGPDKLTEESAAFKILRGNYDHAMDLAYARVHKWKVDHGVNPSKMDERKANLEKHRVAMHKNAFKAFKKWSGDLHRARVTTTRDVPVKWGPDSPDFQDHPIGLYPELYKALPQSIHMEQDAGTDTGVGTSGGFKNDSTWRRYLTEASGAGILAMITGALYGFTRAWGPAGQGGAVGDRVNDAAFLTRALLGIGRTVYTENLRLEWEKIFEQGNVTREGLDEYVSRLFNASSALGITMEQRVTIAAATEQFWANYKYLSEKPIDHEKGWTHEEKNLAISAKVGAFQGAMSRMLNLQDSTIDAMDARRFEGQVIRFLAAATYGVNVTHAIQWFLDTDLSELPKSKIPEACFYALFTLGNLMMGVKEGRSLAGGILGITDTETDKMAQSLQLGATAALTVGGAAWTVDDVVSAATDKLPGGIALDTINAILKAAFTFFLGENFESEFAKFNADPMRGPRQLALPQLMVQGALMLIMLIALFAGGHGAGKPGG